MKGLVDLIYEKHCLLVRRKSLAELAQLDILLDIGNIAFTTASAAVQCMVDAGIYADYADYQKVCQENGWDHEKMRAGVFTFEKGTSKKEITREVNWS